MMLPSKKRGSQTFHFLDPPQGSTRLRSKSKQTKKNNKLLKPDILFVFSDICVKLYILTIMVKSMQIQPQLVTFPRHE